MPDLTTKDSPQSDFTLNWSQLQEGARLMIDPAVADWAQAVPGLQGLDIHIVNLMSGEPKSVYAFGSLVGDASKLPLSSLGISDASLYFYGSVPVAKRYELIHSIESTFRWLLAMQRKMVGAFSFKHSPLIMYHAAELQGRWVLLEANKALADFLGIDVNDLIALRRKLRYWNTCTRKICRS